MGYIVYQLAWEARIHANHVESDVGRVFLACGSINLIVWMCYPIAWGVCEGRNIIAPDSEAVSYGILDLLAKSVFGTILLWGHRNIDLARLGLRIKDVTEGPVYPEGLGGGQKRSVNEPAAAAGANGTQNPADVPVTDTTAA